jgi:hypothetical protein
MARLILVAGAVALGVGVALAVTGNDLALIFIAGGALLVVAAAAMRIAPRRGQSSISAYSDEDPSARRPPRPPRGPDPGG